MGGVTIRGLCLRQTDMKSLVAYSSVAHMGLVLSGLITMTCWGVRGALTIILAHGLCSSGLFAYNFFRYRILFVSKKRIFNSSSQICALRLKNFQIFDFSHSQYLYYKYLTFQLCNLSESNLFKCYF